MSYRKIAREKRLIKEAENVEAFPIDLARDLNLTPAKTFDYAIKDCDWKRVVVVGYDEDDNFQMYASSSMQLRDVVWLAELMKKWVMKNALD
jgi:hypothetical protein